MKLKFYILLFFVASASIGCKNFSNRVENSIPITSMNIEDPVRRYYPIVRGDTLDVTYKFTNTGRYPLIIRDVQAACGCITTDDYDRPIKPNKSGYLNFKYDSSKNIGYVEHYVLIVANIKDTLTNEVKFSTNVVPDPLVIRDYEQIFQKKQKSSAKDLVDGKSKLMYYVPNEEK